MIKKPIIFVLVVLMLVGCSKSSGQWPKSELIKDLPKPSKGEISISMDAATVVIFEVDKVEKDDFSAYADKCYNSGFSDDYYMSSGLFKASKDDLKIMISYDERSSSYKVNVSK